LIFLNIQLLVSTTSGVFYDGSIFSKLGLGLLGLLFVALLIYIVLYSLLTRHKKTASILIHPTQQHKFSDLEKPEFKNVAVALDFSENDEKLLSFAIGQGKENTNYILIHIVESASAKLLGNESDDYETRKDKERIDLFVKELQLRDLHAKGHLGFGKRAQEIVKIVKECNADLLIMGAHGHTGLKDFIYGQTVNTVRHELKIPVLIVNI
jgi:manganese transport protein